VVTVVTVAAVPAMARVGVVPGVGVVPRVPAMACVGVVARMGVVPRVIVVAGVGTVSHRRWHVVPGVGQLLGVVTAVAIVRR
jgi:hypothetical protein